MAAPEPIDAEIIPDEPEDEGEGEAEPDEPLFDPSAADLRAGAANPFGPTQLDGGLMPLDEAVITARKLSRRALLRGR